MALPKIEHPRFEVEIPSTKEKVKFRPFVVKEYKALLQAVEMRNGKAIVNTIADILKACTFGEVDINSLKVFDIDYLFLTIRSKSVGQMVPIFYTCSHCNEQSEGILDLGKLKVVYPENYKEEWVIKIDEKSGIVLKLPSFAQWRKNIEKMYEEEGDDGSAQTDMFNTFIYSCTKSFYEGDEVKLPGVDFTEEELVEYISNLPIEANEKLEEFFDYSTPYCVVEFQGKCSKCGADNSFETGSIEDFFV